MRECLIEFSSRKTIGRPVPRLILEIPSLTDTAALIDSLMLTDGQTNKGSTKCGPIRLVYIKPHSLEVPAEKN
jgi:hypothetical protein